MRSIFTFNIPVIKIFNIGHMLTLSRLKQNAKAWTNESVAHTLTNS